MAYVGAVAFLVLNPDLAEPLRILRLLQHWASNGGWTAAWVGKIEFAANVAVFSPPPVIAGILWRRHGVLTWTGATFLCSGAVEVVQWAMMGQRTASTADVVANTLGAALGASMFACVASIRSRGRAALSTSSSKAATRLARSADASSEGRPHKPLSTEGRPS